MISAKRALRMAGFTGPFNRHRWFVPGGRNDRREKKKDVCERILKAPARVRWGRGDDGRARGRN
jgi:hypothetical protein